jgi:hypothetical protein
VTIRRFLHKMPVISYPLEGFRRTNAQLTAF